MVRIYRSVIGGLMLSTIVAVTTASGAERLGSYSVDPNRSSVSGLSSGAFMADQFHIAFSETLIGVGIVAGGPYYCARGSWARALYQCMDTVIGIPDAADLLAVARNLEEDGRIDPLANLADNRVYIFSGASDDTVATAVAEQAATFYALAGVPEENIALTTSINAGHGFVTMSYGGTCTASASPYINDCDYDQAGAILQQLYGSLQPPREDPAGSIVEFDQTEFLATARLHGLSETGFVFVPQSCASGEDCRVHIVFHGCRQSHEWIGDQFYRHAGYNRWADTNDIIVLYPQTTTRFDNPRGCWDWFGYDDAAYHTRDGRQMAAVKAMLDRLSGVR